jgi:S1-C subfamily serine protease
LIGVNTAIFAPTGVFSGIGFAIPVNDAKVILKDLIEKGYVERSWIGVEIADIEGGGVFVNGVAAGSPAAKANLRAGDVILELEGKKEVTSQILQDTVSATPPGKPLSIKVKRGDETKTLTVKPESMPRPKNN